MKKKKRRRIVLGKKTEPKTLKFYLQKFDPIEIEYNSGKGRVIRIFHDEGEARTFYIDKKNSGDKPKILPLKEIAEDVDIVLERKNYINILPYSPPATIPVNNTHRRNIETSVARFEDVSWTEGKVITYKALRSLGAISPESAVKSTQVVEKIKELGGDIIAHYVRYYCYHGVPAGYIKIAQICGYHGYLFYLTELGASLDYDKERLKQYPNGIDIYSGNKKKK